MRVTFLTPPSVFVRAFFTVSSTRAARRWGLKMSGASRTRFSISFHARSRMPLWLAFTPDSATSTR
ncbi:MAG: hypothetical protein JSS44_13610 [Proteobacteria bacterium]|nr:hypothetical protein [Pseudomonadota bacterium]